MFAELLQKARAKNGATQEELAQKACVTREYISMLERGKRVPTILVFIRIARALDVSPADLIKEVEKTIVRK